MVSWNTDQSPRMNRVTKLAAMAGMIGPALFGSVLLVLTVIEYDFMRSLGWEPLSVTTVVWPSGLALGPYGVSLRQTCVTSATVPANLGGELWQQHHRNPAAILHNSNCWRNA
jgi:hypothetical protein